MGKNGRWISFLKVRSLPQVLVSVRVLELNRTKMRTLGMDWSVMTQNKPALPGVIGQRKDSLAIVSGLLTNSFTVTDKKFLLNQVITALESKGVARTLSEPNLATLSGEVATFLSGGDVPIQSLATSGTTVFSGFEFREFGIRLTIRPLVGEDGRTITLDINPEVSDVVPADPSNPQAAPTFTRTTLLSTAQLKDGEGLIVGGLIGKKDNSARQQVPILGDIPILGHLFSKTTEDETERELALILLPKIIYPRPANSFALEAPGANFPIRGGAFIDPDLGRVPTVPDFYRRLATGEIEYR
jgi:pilus assembly protein CpaC